MRVDIFRGRPLTPDLESNKTARLKWALEIAKKDFKPISNGEFVYDLRIYKFGAIIEKLRKEGWIIETIPTDQRNVFHYKLVAKPGEKLKLFDA